MLEGLRDKVAVACEPAREGGADVDGLRGGGGGGGESDGAFVDGNVLLGRGCDAYLGTLVSMLTGKPLGGSW